MRNRGSPKPGESGLPSSTTTSWPTRVGCEAVDLAREKGAAAAAGARTLLLPKGNIALCRSFAACSWAKIAAGRSPKDRYGNKAAPNTGNFLLHRNVFDAVGTFDEALVMSGEDSYLYYKMRQAGITVWYTPAAVVQHVIPAYRLQDEYFRWTCMRHGWNTARVYWRRVRLLVRLLIFTARLGQAVAVLAPRLLWARLRGNEEQALATRCRLWRAEGYVRGTLRWAAPRWFAQEVSCRPTRFPHRTAAICFAEPRPMKVLLCHNYYLQAGGEDVVFADEGAMLEEHGHQVVRYTLHNNIIEKMPRWQLARRTLWNPQSYGELRG